MKKVAQGNYPRLCERRLQGADGGENGTEDGSTGRQACGINDGANRGLSLGCPHSAVPVGDLALTTAGCSARSQ
jgi:hypothetical protein